MDLVSDPTTTKELSDSSKYLGDLSNYLSGVFVVVGDCFGLVNLKSRSFSSTAIDPLPQNKSVSCNAGLGLISFILISKAFYGLSIVLTDFFF